MLLALPSPSGRPSTILPFNSRMMVSASASADSYDRSSICVCHDPSRILAASAAPDQMQQHDSMPESQIAEALAAMQLVAPGERFSAEPLSGGVSCDVWRIDTGHGATFVLKRALAKLRVEADWRAPATRSHTEVE